MYVPRGVLTVLAVLVWFAHSMDRLESAEPGARLAEVGGQRWAVLVGVNRYAQLGHLTYCVADAKNLRDQLIAAGFARENVFLLVDGAEESADLPFRENIQRRIEPVRLVGCVLVSVVRK
jgi:hypothetical protein